jgi:1-deoxy-D-xylulose-5-phosphate synthase
MLKFAVEFDGPIALRYPRGEAYDGMKEFRAPIQYGKSEVLYEEEDIALLAVGSMVKTAGEVRQQLKEIGYSCTLINGRFIKPIDTDVVAELSKEHRLLVTMEENVRSGGYGEKVRDFVQEQRLPVDVLTIALPDEYVEHGNVALLHEEVGIDAGSVVKKIIQRYITCQK